MTTTRLALLAAAALGSPCQLVAQTVAPAGLIRSVAARTFVLVVKGDGSIVGWGSEEEGLATRPRSPSGVVLAPVAIAVPGKARQVAVGEGAAYALMEDGTVVAWGANADGQLGKGAAGTNRELGTYPKPSVTAVRVTGLNDIVQITAGARHALALRKDGTVWAWGSREDGTLGDGDARNARVLQVLSALAPIAVPGLKNVIQIATGWKHNLALRQDGHVMSWGTNSDGELGLGTRETGWTPAEVRGSGAAHGVSAAIRDDGTVWIWGSNASGMMGNGGGPLSPDDPGGRNPVPMPVKGIAGARSISIGEGHVAVLLKDGTLRMWGHDGWGQLGVGTSGGYHQNPVKVTTLVNVAAVYLGGRTSFAVQTDGSLWWWGLNATRGLGSLGKDQHRPMRLDLP